MSRPEKRASFYELYTKDIHEAVALLKQAITLMRQNNIPPNPVQYALWYAYGKGGIPDLNRHMDGIIKNHDSFPPEAATHFFQEYIIGDALGEGRIWQQQTINLVDGMERDVLGSVEVNLNFQTKLSYCLEKLESSADSTQIDIFNELKSNAQLMQEQQRIFLSRLHAAQREIRTLRDKLKKTSMAATLDGLTQIFNREAFNNILQQALITAPDRVALVMLDIDHFKKFNDIYGHALGDRVIQHVGQVLRALPSHAVASRYGGEEFCIILQNCTDLDSAQNFAEGLRVKIQSLRIKVRITDKIIDTITASLGVAVFTRGDTMETLLDRADKALYKAKHNGRNQVQR